MVSDPGSTAAGTTSAGSRAAIDRPEWRNAANGTAGTARTEAGQRARTGAGASGGATPETDGKLRSGIGDRDRGLGIGITGRPVPDPDPPISYFFEGAVSRRRVRGVVAPRARVSVSQNEPRPSGVS